MTEHLLQKFLAVHTYDIRVLKDGTWIDQKCMPDEIRFVAECILSWVDQTHKSQFESPEIWHSPFAREQVQSYFGKPDPFSREATDEYNKFFRQPMKMFAVAGVLKNHGRNNNTIQFSIADRDVLEFVARNDWNAYLFLTHYIEKVLKDSGLWDPFETFFDLQTNDSLSVLRDKFIDFEKAYTPKNTAVEIRRILPKVLNPLACRFGKRGLAKGRMIGLKMNFSFMRYNQENWRDSGKPKDVTRRGFAKGHITVPPSATYLTQKAKDEVRVFNDSFRDSASEVLGPMRTGKATHMHHMFMASSFPDIADFPENIIALTPGQHYSFAHPDGNTSKIDPGYQCQCLLSKSETIERNVVGKCGPVGFYDFGKFAFVLDMGFSTTIFSSIPSDDFTELRHQIDNMY